ncbi:MAG: ABC transporter permease [Parabacteroides merdae]
MRGAFRSRPSSTFFDGSGRNASHRLALWEERVKATFLLPVKASSHPLFNPDLDYSVYLSNPFFFILFQVIILLTTVYVIGGEVKFGTGAEWLSTAGGNIMTAVVGKLLPYTVIFSLMSILANYVMFGLMHIPFSCGFWPFNLTAILFVVSTQALAVFIFSVFPCLVSLSVSCRWSVRSVQRCQG